MCMTLMEMAPCGSEGEWRSSVSLPSRVATCVTKKDRRIAGIYVLRHMCAYTPRQLVAQRANRGASRECVALAFTPHRLVGDVAAPRHSTRATSSTHHAGTQWGDTGRFPASGACLQGRGRTGSDEPRGKRRYRDMRTRPFSVLAGRS